MDKKCLIFLFFVGVSTTTAAEVTFIGTGAPRHEHKIYLNGGCDGSVFRHRFAQANIQNGGKWNLSVNLTTPCEFQWRWSVDGAWEADGVGNNRNAILKSDKDYIIYSAYGQIDPSVSAALILQPVAFILDKFPDFDPSGKDEYSVCGRYHGISNDYQLDDWTCSDPQKTNNGKKITIIYKLIEHSEFVWKWRNRRYDNISNDIRHQSGHESGSTRRFHIGYGCADKSKIRVMTTQWNAFIVGKAETGVCKLRSKTLASTSSSTLAETTTLNFIPTATTVTSSQLSTTSPAAPSICTGNITKQLEYGEITIDVETEPGRILRLAAGDYKYKIISMLKNLTIHISISSKQGISTTSTPGSTSTVPGSVCVNSNITKQLEPGQEIADVEIAPGQSLRLPAGDYVYIDTLPDGNCTVHVSVSKDSANKCPPMIKGIASSTTGLGELALHSGGTVHKLSLPIGECRYQTLSEDDKCSTVVKILDYNVVRRLQITAYYDVSCKLALDPIARPTVEVMASENTNRIESHVCGKDCKPLSGSKAELSCTNDTLTVTWSTDRTFGGDVTDVPSDLLSRVTSRLEQMKNHVFNLVVLTHQPPIVQPVEWNLYLSTSCLNNRTFVVEKNSCP